MKLLKQALLWVLILSMALSAVSCGKEEEAVTTEELSATEQAKEDEKFLKQFVKDYRAGKYAEKQMFLYDDLSQYIQLGEYKGIEYLDDKMLDPTVTDEDVKDYMTGIQIVGIMKDEEFEEITEGVVQKFDTVTMDYEGFIDGVSSESTTGSDQELLIGSKQFIDGFEESLIGKPIGEKVVLDLKFSPYYSGADVAGKPAQFHVTVKKVSRAKEIPELKVEDINTLYGSDFKNMEEVEADIRGYLEQDKENTAYSALANYLQLALMDRCTVLDYPMEELEYYRKHFIDYYTQEMEEGQTIDEFCEEVLGVSYEEFDADALSYARETVAGTMMILSVAKAENITCTDEQLEAMVAGLYEAQGINYGNLESFMTDYMDIYGPDYFENRVVSAAVIQFIVDNAAKVTE